MNPGIPLQFVLSSWFALASGVAFMLMARWQPRARLFRYWGPGFILLTAADVAYAYRYIAPDLVSIVLAHALLQSALVTLHAGVRALDAGRPRRFDALGWLTVAATVGGAAWFTYVDPSFAKRLMLVAGTCALLIGRTAWLLSTHSRRLSSSIPANLLAGLWWLMTAILIITMLATAIYGEQARDMWQAGPQVETLFIVRPLLMVLIVGVAIWMEFAAIRLTRNDQAQRADEAIQAGRAAYLEACAKAIAHHDGNPLCVALIDLDNHKVVLRQHGQVAADALLDWTIDIIRGALRDGQSAERHGPDDFIVMLPRTSAAEARIIAKDIHKRIETRTCMAGQTPIRTTVSIGIAQLQGDRATPAALAAAAQVAVYKARSAGRNRIEIADEAFPAIDYARL